MAKAKVNTRDKVLASATTILNVVECGFCKTKHAIDGKDFVVIYGNASIGTQLFVIDGNIDERGKVIGSFVCCRRGECLERLIELLSVENKV